MTTATFAVCKGKTEALDIVSVLQPPGRRYYSFLSITYGLIANLDVGTENLRWGCSALARAWAPHPGLGWDTLRWGLGECSKTLLKKLITAAGRRYCLSFFVTCDLTADQAVVREHLR